MKLSFSLFLIVKKTKLKLTDLDLDVVTTRSFRLCHM